MDYTATGEPVLFRLQQIETFYNNAGSSKRYGIESLLSYYPFKSLECTLAYTYSHFTYISLNTGSDIISGTNLPNSPQHIATLNLDYNLTEKFMIGVAMELQSRAYIDGTNVDWIGGYTLFHALLSYQFKIFQQKAEAMLYIRNIFDKEYVAFTEPDPDGNSYQPAATREIFFNLRLSF
ncbi:MAG: hypothetical protein A2Y62_19495 [Candidatus Fischerbacteria bacterium RBG_13_37_8]|uniref:TonB-dependent receptor-like beta-barrel domain-containing protein n=1 Tax=Candidatus Fischerbacteria bacterium RBG_13_37_8 TaxID=1817863 RepID=A0A1F5VXE0_9BACT|nr:MAG: hypothetical protein A2Y62_19495 [Candidatus Fischerbacteria bacterium RBG_13_37_8]